MMGIMDENGIKLTMRGDEVVAVDEDDQLEQFAEEAIPVSSNIHDAKSKMNADAKPFNMPEPVKGIVDENGIKLMVNGDEVIALDEDMELPEDSIPVESNIHGEQSSTWPIGFKLVNEKGC